MMDGIKRGNLNMANISQLLCESIDAKPMREDLDNWYLCMRSIGNKQYVPLQYKPRFLDYQAEYFKEVYSDYKDISMVLYRGGKPSGIWPVCIYRKDDKLIFGTAGTALMEPLLPMLPKAEAQRSVIEKCLTSLFNVLERQGGVLYSALKPYWIKGVVNGFAN